ncbi:MAG: efflux RND transporter periplasmic adaptor subunit [Opitutaceae bacterium]|nr:efflux RND transporter periplasmic adaptor subunit [Opitutaceae bacterium]
MSPPPSAPATRRRWFPYAAGVVLLLLLGFGLRPRPSVVETARAVTGPLHATVSEEGKTRIRDRFVVSAPVTGQLRRVPFKPGAVVAAGDVVAAIEPMAATPLDPRSRALAEARRTAAAATLEKVAAAHALAVSELRRVERMFAEQTVSPQDLEGAQLRETVAAREVVAAEGALRAAEAELAGAGSGRDAGPGLVEVRAPVAGRVLRVFQESERPLAAGTPVLELGDPSDLEVVIELLSRDGAALAPGARVELDQWGGPQPLAARVRLVEPAAFTKISALGVEEQRVNVVADIVTPLAERPTLGDNFRVEARVFLWESDRVLKVPVSALFRRGGAWAAYVVRGGRAALVPVEAGRSSGTEVQVLAGLQEGDEVVLYPGDRVQDGMRVQPVRI